MNQETSMDGAGKVAGAEPTDQARSGERKGVLRGSSLMLVGRLFSVGVNFFVQVLTVRYLAKADFGAFAWALSIVSMGANFTQLGLHRSVARFVPMYQERHEYDEMFGTITVAIVSILGVGISVVVAVLASDGILSQHFAEDPTAIGLLLIMIGLVPTQALDNLFQGFLAIFAEVWAIFFRRYVLGPGLKLLAVLLVIAYDGSVYMLAECYLVAGIIGVVLYAHLMWKAFISRGLLEKLHPQRMAWPFRRMLAFGVPLLTTDLAIIFETTVVVVLLEYFRGTTDVAALRAVAPVAGLCMVIVQALKMLYRPQAARYLARGDESGLATLYWQSAAWVAVATFPVFACSVILAQPVTVLLFGPEYASSAILLAILATGKYIDASIGLNTYTLMTYGRVRLITILNITTVLISCLLAVWLIGTWGALGGAIATAAAILIRNILHQAALIVTTGLGRPPKSSMLIFAMVVLLMGTLEIIRVTTHSIAGLVVGTIFASVLLIYVNRHTLELRNTFPELARVPLFRYLV